MSIDRIRRDPGVSGVAPSETAGPERVDASAAAGEAFEIARAAGLHAAAPLDRLRAGEITPAQYLEEKVAAATAHLSGRVSAEQLDFIQSSLREQLSSDPVLVEWGRAATGVTPPSRE